MRDEEEKSVFAIPGLPEPSSQFTATGFVTRPKGAPVLGTGEQGALRASKRREDVREAEYPSPGDFH